MFTKTMSRIGLLKSVLTQASLEDSHHENHNHHEHHQSNQTTTNVHSVTPLYIIPDAASASNPGGTCFRLAGQSLRRGEPGRARLPAIVQELYLTSGRLISESLVAPGSTICLSLT